LDLESGVPIEDIFEGGSINSWSDSQKVYFQFPSDGVGFCIDMDIQIAKDSIAEYIACMLAVQKYLVRSNFGLN
jgi:hypothetical protein